MLTKEIAKEVVTQTMIRLNRNINIMDKSGIIIASGDLERMSQAHYGAIEVIRTGNPLIIQESNSHHWEGALPGINLPIQFQDQIIGVIGITGNPDELMEFGELVKMITEMIIHQAYMTEQLEWKQNLKELIFEELITTPLKIESIKQKMHLIDCQIEIPYQVAVVDLELNHVKKSVAIQLLADIFPMNETLFGFLSVNRLFILSSTIQDDQFRKKLMEMFSVFERKHISTKIGMGSAVTEQTHIKYSYHEALCAIKFGGSKPLVAYPEIEMMALLDQLDERTKQQFAERVLGDLSEKFIDTLEQFNAHNFNIGECAKNMFIHRNSLIYRIKKVKEITGYDPQLFQDALVLQLAIWVRKMAE
ncbi:hypothetical protein F7731_00640 [Cytobacillus depressus]|uniref:Transcriptional regulator n=1 Tax=Cytobacillus depressus TaxID=1602942 RepID=A0A6L3VFK9_9BACI|nr:sugar diacid recognition domain-containing protein [Cytobacillus depressus]KAB2338115.1 hypothetical protein F7731_00640 [Cytobacillus depressus]